MTWATEKAISLQLSCQGVKSIIREGKYATSIKRKMGMRPGYKVVNCITFVS